MDFTFLPFMQLNILLFIKHLIHNKQLFNFILILFIEFVNKMFVAFFAALWR